MKSKKWINYGIIAIILTLLSSCRVPALPPPSISPIPEAAQDNLTQPTAISTQTTEPEPTGTPTPSSTPEATHTVEPTAPALAPYEQLAQLNFPKGYVDNYAELQYGTSKIGGLNLPSISGTNAQGEEVVLAARLDLKNETAQAAIWLQVQKKDNVFLVSDAAWDGSFDLSNLDTEKIKTFIQNANIFTGDERYADNINSKGDVVVYALSMEDFIWKKEALNISPLGSGDALSTYEATISDTGSPEKNRMVSTWFVEENGKTHVISMYFFSNSLIELAHNIKSTKPGAILQLPLTGSVYSSQNSTKSQAELAQFSISSIPLLEKQQIKEIPSN